jgi:hypothetical protein
VTASRDASITIWLQYGLISLMSQHSGYPVCRLGEVLR